MWSESITALYFFHTLLCYRIILSRMIQIVIMICCRVSGLEEKTSQFCSKAVTTHIMWKNWRLCFMSLHVFGAFYFVSKSVFGLLSSRNWMNLGLKSSLFFFHWVHPCLPGDTASWVETENSPLFAWISTRSFCRSSHSSWLRYRQTGEGNSSCLPKTPHQTFCSHRWVAFVFVGDAVESYAESQWGVNC